MCGRPLRAWALAAVRCRAALPDLRFGACLLVPLQDAPARCVAVRALELGRWCRCRVQLPDVRFGAWALVPLQGTNLSLAFHAHWSQCAGAAGGRCRVPLRCSLFCLRRSFFPKQFTVGVLS